MKTKWNLVDTSFGNAPYSVQGVESKYCYWNKTTIDKACPTFYVNDCIYEIRKGETIKQNSFGLLYESRAIIPEVHRHAYRVIDKFNLFFTPNSELLKYSNARWIPAGGVWIGGSHGLGEIKIFEKDKLVSMVSSDKRMCSLHDFRLKVFEEVAKFSNVDRFGSAWGGWVPINKTLEKYMFSIVMENYIDDLYFTEKINNCFATGTIPIYFGAKQIDKIYNPEGIIRFTNMDELVQIIENLNEEEYYKRTNAVNDNFKRCREFLSIEDYIYKNYFIGQNIPMQFPKGIILLNYVSDNFRKNTSYLNDSMKKYIIHSLFKKRVAE